MVLWASMPLYGPATRSYIMTLMTTAQTAKIAVPRDDASFERDACEIMGQLRDAFAAIIEQLPGTVRRAADLQRVLSINRTLAWQIHKVAHASDPLSEADHVPRPAAMTGFFDAVRQNGGGGEQITAAKAAFEKFNRLIQVHAGSRTAFISMISGLRDTGLETVDLANRRAMFKGQSHFLGVEADVHLGCYFFKPSDSDENLIDAVGVRGLLGLRRYRRDIGWIISSIDATDDDAVKRRDSEPAPLIASAEHPDIGLLPAFCSSPLPDLKYIRNTNGSIDVEIQPNGLGATSATSCVIGHVFRSAFSRYCDAHNTYQHCQTLVRTPCKVLVQDLLVHHDLEAHTPEVLLYSDHRDVGSAMHGRERDLLSIRASVERLGRGAAVLSTPDVPRYEQLARFVFDQLEWKSNDFVAYRYRMEYPIMPSSVATRFALQPSLQ